MSLFNSILKFSAKAGAKFAAGYGVYSTADYLASKMEETGKFGGLYTAGLRGAGALVGAQLMTSPIRMLGGELAAYGKGRLAKSAGHAYEQLTIDNKLTVQRLKAGEWSGDISERNRRVRGVVSQGRQRKALKNIALNANANWQDAVGMTDHMGKPLGGLGYIGAGNMLQKASPMGLAGWALGLAGKTAGGAAYGVAKAPLVVGADIGRIAAAPFRSRRTSALSMMDSGLGMVEKSPINGWGARAVGWGGLAGMGYGALTMNQIDPTQTNAFGGRQIYEPYKGGKARGITQGLQESTNGLVQAMHLNR